jgi:magnesium transporter
MVVLTSLDRSRIGELIPRKEFFWLDLTDASNEELEAMRSDFELEPLHRVPGSGRIMFVEQEDYIGFPWKGVEPGAEHPEPFVVDVYVSGDWIITTHDEPIEEFEHLRTRLTRTGGQEEQHVVARVLDAVCDSFVDVLSGIDLRIAEIETDVVQDPTPEQLTRITSLRRDLLGLRKIINPQRDLMTRIGDDVADLPGLEGAERDYLRDVANYLGRLSDQVDTTSELLTSTVDLYLSTASNRLNEVIRKLTIVATIFLPLTFVTGFFGQNFGWLVRHINSLTAFLIWGIGGLILAVGALILWFRRSRLL